MLIRAVPFSAEMFLGFTHGFTHGSAEASLHPLSLG